MTRRLALARRLWLAMLVAAALLAACGGDDADESAAITATASGGTAQSTPATGPRAAGEPDDIDRDATLRIADDLVQGVGAVFDPVKYNGRPFPFMALIYDSLAYRNPDGSLSPGLAVDWTFPDQSTLELSLREGVTFQDGTPFDAEAVKFSWERLMATPEDAMTKVEVLRQFQSVEVVDASHVRVTLSEPIVGQLRDSLHNSLAGLAIVSPTAAAEKGDAFNEHPVGAGPYRFVEHRPGQSLRLERWDGYWNPEAQRAAAVEFIHTEQGAPTVTALAGGAVDVAWVGANSVGSLRSQGLEVEQFEASQRTAFYQMCVSRPPFDNIVARQAAAHAVDRAVYISTAYQGLAKPNDMFLPPANFNYPASVENPYPYDVDRAKKLVAEAGVEGAPVTLLIGPDPIQALIAQVLQQQLNAVGFDARIHQSANSFSDLPTVEWNIYFGTGSSPSTSSAFLLPGGVGNSCNYNNPAYTDAWNRTADVTLAEEDVAKAWVDLQEATFEDLPMLNIANQDALVAHTENVGGVIGDLQFGDVPTYTSLFIRK